MLDAARSSDRTAPPSEIVQPSSSMVVRGRLIGLLRERFERRVTVIEAGAGFGKSTLLAQAIHENRIEGLGTDVLVRLTDADQDPALLLRNLASVLGASPSEATVGRVSDSVWSRAPASVAVILDDVHRLGHSEGAWDVLCQLLDVLPSNGHLVASGRTTRGLRVARLLSRDDALIITESEMAFDDRELAEVVALRSIPAGVAAGLPRWPALATLIGAAGSRRSMDYLWDEVLRAIPDDRRRILAAAVEFGEIDDDLVTALGGSCTVRELVEGIPLVDTLADGTCRLHDLWSEALAPAITGEERRLARRAGATMLLTRGAIGRAAEAFARACDTDGLAQVILSIARRPPIAADIPEINRVLGMLPASMLDGAGARYLDAVRLFAVDNREAATAFARAAVAARASGEVELELLSLWRQTQLADLERPGGAPLTDRLIELADSGLPLARSIHAFIESRRCQWNGDPVGAIERLSELDGFGPEQRAIARANRYVDLGRPELLDAATDGAVPGGSGDLYAAQAAWMQGKIDPATAWSIARRLLGRTERMPLANATSIRSIVIAMGIAAGEHTEIVPLSEFNVRRARSTVRLNELFAHVAAALVELVVVGEDAAVNTFTRLLEDVPIGRWPERPYLYALAVIRGLLPGGDVLDQCRFGPSVSVAVEAGAALAALRRGDVALARALPWHTPTLLRVHVPPPLLAELALAAGDTPGASAVLGSLPHLRTWMRRIADRETSAPARAAAVELAQAASAAAQALPARPDYDIRIDLLGGLAVRRSDGGAIDGWGRRQRVRQLLAYIALHRDVSRSDVAAEMWPGLSQENGSANLRVNLHHLQTAFQPDRNGEPPWFLQATDNRLRLVTDGVIIDVELVDAAMKAAVRAEAAGLPSVALAQYEKVAELVRDDLLPELQTEWVVYERIRLRSIAQAAASRHGELVLARGEPEAALSIAARAQRLDPHSERAHRLSIRCHLALGSTGAARKAAGLLRTILLEAGIAADHETTLLLRRINA